MTEAEWLSCTDPWSMLEYLRGKGTDRKLRLFACACCRRIWHLLRDKRSRRAVRISELYADRLATNEELRAAGHAARQAVCKTPGGNGLIDPKLRHWTWAVLRTAVQDEHLLRKNSLTYIVNAVAEANGREELDHLRAIARDLGEGEFQHLALAPAWVAPPVASLAQAIYDDCRFEELPRLADALTAAGCTNAAILEHCRSGGELVRGCWVVDLVLGKE